MYNCFDRPSIGAMRAMDSILPGAIVFLQIRLQSEL